MGNSFSISSQAIGILLFLLIVVLALSTFGLKFINKKITSNYFFWAIPALFFFCYFIALRYFEDWSSFFSDTSFITGGELTGSRVEIYRNSVNISKALLLDLCPFLGVFLPLSLILDKTRKTSYVMAPFCIIGGMVSFVSILNGVSPGGNVEFTFQYLFIGHKENELYFFLHSYLIIIGTCLVFQSNVNKLKYLWSYYLFIGLYFIYIYIIMETTGVIYNTTGVSINDWLLANNPITNQPFDGEYSGVSPVLGNLEYPWVMILGYFLGWLSITFITTLQILFRNFDIKKFIKDINLNIKKK